MIHPQLFTPDAASPEPLQCISLWQPWCNWVALGWKTVETRLHARFASLAGKRIGIHSALKWDDAAIRAAARYLTAQQVERTNGFLHLGGHVGCTAMVREVRWLDGKDSQAALIDCGIVRRFGLVLDDVRILPISESTLVKGRQGIFKVAMANEGPA